MDASNGKYPVGAIRQSATASFLVPLCVGVVAIIAVTTLFWQHGLTIEFAELALFVVDLCVLSVIDIRTRRIPNLCIFAALAIRILYLAASTLFVGSDGAAAASLWAKSLTGFFVSGLGTGAIAGIASRLSGRESLGFGDIKLFAVAGFYFGTTRALLAVFLACLFALAIPLVNHLRSNPDTTFPFGPAISLACATIMLLP